MSTDVSKNSENIASRQIRVFISSTFRDMQEERDYLAKFIFPQLRKLCESRGITWGEVDLRWGVTDEQAAEGKVLPICLEEIKRCRPYFIGLLGERYGWIPDAIPPDVIEREPWLKEHLRDKKSVTELEILHGVLREEKMHGHAFFYFRNPAFIASIPSGQRQNFINKDAESTEKLKQLKEEIRHAQAKQVCQLRENYSDPKALGDMVLTDLTKVINEKWPEGSQLDPLDREAMDHEACAQSRERVYVERQAYFDRLDTHAAANDTQSLVILGESGSGKSALLANWVARYRQIHSDTLVLQHYIGATPYSADWAAMLRRLMGEFKRHLDIQQNIPEQPDALRNAFPNWLYMAAAKGRVVLVLDALNQLEDRDGASDLVWLPLAMPKNVRLIVSTLPGRTLDEIQKRNWPTFKVELLSADERRKLIAEYLSQYAKNLNAVSADRIATAPQSANPLYLRVLLDELRLVGSHEELKERISDYLKAKSPYALYEKVIARWEQDYGNDLVSQSLNLIWIARCGLSEVELLDLLGENRQPLPRAKWTPFNLAAENAIVLRSGLLNFGHDYLRVAVKKRWLEYTETVRVLRLQLAKYFESQKAITSRTLDELPWQLEKADDYDGLKKCFTNIPFFMALLSRREADATKYFKFLKKQMPLEDVFFEALEANVDASKEETSQDQGYRYLIVGRFFEMQGFLTSAEKFIRRAVAIDESLFGHNHANIARDSTTLALLLGRKGNSDEAEKCFLRVLEILSKIADPNPADVSSALQNLALHYSCLARYSESEAYYRRALETASASPHLNDSIIPPILFNLAGCLHALNRPFEAEPLERQAIELGERIWGNSHPNIALYLEELASHLITKRPGEAEQLARRAEKIYTDSFGDNDPRLSGPLTVIANIRQLSYHLPEAEALLRRALKLQTSQEEAEETRIAFAFENLSTVVQKQGRSKEAAELLRNAIQHWTTALGGQHSKIQQCLTTLKEIETTASSKKARWQFW